jgi:hypothetical protein
MTDETPWPRFQVLLRVKPTHRHPLYGEMEYGILHLFLYAPDSNDAMDRGAAIAAALPFESLGNVVRGGEDRRETLPALVAAQSMAEQTGLGIALIGAPAGADPIPGFEEWRDSQHFPRWFEHGRPFPAQRLVDDANFTRGYLEFPEAHFFNRGHAPATARGTMLLPEFTNEL